MKLFFTNEDYYYKAMLILNSECKTSLTRVDAFILLISNLPFGDLENLCIEIGRYYNISKEDAYKLLQTGKIKDNLLDLAYNIIDSGSYLGNRVINNFNTSSWLSHSLYEARLCEILASKLNLSKDIAFNYGLLHDYGRKYAHDFSHVIKGFEKLVDMGLKESRACLTHSFINDGRFNNNEIPDVEIKYVNGKEYFENEYDNLSKLLRNYSNTDYDRILNIADLMASSHGILSPMERLHDILSRRGELDKSPNRIYFLTSFYNTLLWYLKKINECNELNYLDYKDLSLSDVYKYLDNISSTFYNVVMDSEKKRIKEVK
ncbi:MAG: hypothetical protein J6X02_03675 [Bacilli bacterium]|nr:hypothetical protein [Bacilli bacterium]